MQRLRLISKNASLFLSTAILLASCSSTTIINSYPLGAKLYVDGSPAGKTPFPYSDTKIVGSSTSIRLEMEGFEPFNTSFSRNEELDPGALVGGIFLTIPFLWIMKYKPVHNYELQPLAPSEPANKPLIRENSDDANKAARLREYKKLLDEKILTPAEYEREKKRILEEK